MARRTTSKARRHALMQGYRSGLEERISRQIVEAGLPLRYESEKIAYIWPAREAKYTPDFWLPSADGGFFIETKGRWTVDDRQKHLLVREQHPNVEVRFIFSNANAPLYKGSSTTYGQFCERHGFKFAHKNIPDEWLREGSNDNEPERQNPNPPAEGGVD